MPQGCTDDFAARHLRAEIPATLDEAVRQAEAVLGNRYAYEDRHPRTVLFITPDAFARMEDAARGLSWDMGAFGARIPWAVTWIGTGHYDVVRDAAGFEGWVEDGRFSRLFRVLADGGSELLFHAVPVRSGVPAPAA